MKYSEESWFKKCCCYQSTTQELNPIELICAKMKGEVAKKVFQTVRGERVNQKSAKNITPEDWKKNIEYT